VEVWVEGKVGREKVALVWRDGELEGDEAAVMLVRDQAALMEGRSIGVSPLWTRPPTTCRTSGRSLSYAGWLWT
jgi:hypothetical protein